MALECFTLRSMLSALRLLLVLSSIGASTCLAAVQDAVVAFPKNYSLVLDNDVVSVIHAHYGPHEAVGVHEHSKFPTLYVYLNNSGPVHFKHDENPPFEITRPPATKGSFRVSPGRIERHTVENLSDKPSDFLRVELKQVPLGGKLQLFRGKAPDTLAQNSDAVEFSSQWFDVQRMICQPGSPCQLRNAASPSLIVALSPLKIITSGSAQHDEFAKDGDIQWIQNGSQAISVVAISDAPVHLLRVIFKPAAK